MGALRVTLVLAGLLAISGAALAGEAIPNFAPNDHTSWHPDRAAGDDFLPPETGPGPIAAPENHPYIPNAEGDYAASNPTYRIADLSNPILKPSVAEQMKRDNDEVLAGKIPFIARERCYPAGVPAFDVFRRVGAPMLFFLQTEKEVVMIWRVDQQARHVYLNVPHSQNPKPSWYGESVGRYEGDTLIVDTIGLNAKSFVDNYRTPHTERLHVVERFRIVDGGKTLETRIHVEDDGAFTTPWNAIQRFTRFEGVPGNPGTMTNESICAESGSLSRYDALNYGASHARELVPIPQSMRPDF